MSKIDWKRHPPPDPSEFSDFGGAYVSVTPPGPWRPRLWRVWVIAHADDRTPDSTLSLLFDARPSDERVSALVESFVTSLRVLVREHGAKTKD